MKKTLTKKISIISLALLMAVATPLSYSQHYAFADKYDDQMAALQREIDAYQAQADRLRKEADTLQNKIAQLSNRKASVQKKLDLSKAKYNKLKKQIKETEEKIQENRDALDLIISNLYVDSAITPLEALASSNNVGDLFDKQAYRESISDTLKTTIDDIKQLKQKLEQDKQEVKAVLDKQTAQRNSLAAIESQQQRLLAQTKGKEAAYKQQVNSARNELNATAERQRKYYEDILNGPGGGNSGTVGSFQYTNWSGNQGCGGGYPYCGPQDSMVDPWQLYNRECVSYVAWAISQRFGKYVEGFNGEGNAYQWPYSAPKYSGAYRVGSPQPGDAVILPQSGDFAPIGHAMVVESVSGGTVHVSQYNFYGTGQYSTMDIQTTGVIFLRFQNR